MRLDGTITHLSERDQRMKKFHSDDRYSVFLLTTQVCIVCDICFINSTSINLPNISDKKKIRRRLGDKLYHIMMYRVHIA
jgi:hypothetical protein